MMMNLTIDPWIPALGADGRRQLFSIQTLFAEAHELRDLEVKPLERIALMRLLICITQAALDGPADEAAWEACKPLIQPRVDAYLKKWKDSFELFGDGPRFLQLPNLKPGKETDEGNPATKLDLGLANGNNSTLFDNAAGEDRRLRPARSALNLLTFECFAASGRIGIAKWNGQDTDGKGSSNHAPCTPSSMVHTLALGSTLIESLHLNLLSRDAVEGNKTQWGKPVWEQPVASASDRSARENATLTYLGRLVPLSRAVRLSDEGLSIILANGLDYPIFPAFREATATVIKRKDELALLPASTSRSLWRQLTAISVTRRTGEDSVCGPLALNHFVEASDRTLWIGAFIADQGKIEDVVECTYSLPSGMFRGFGRVAFEKGVGHAEMMEGTLSKAVKSYASSLKVVSPPYERARQFYWTQVEQHLSNLFDLARNTDLAADLPNSPWGKSVEAAARSAYDRLCPHQTPRQIQAYAQGLRKFHFVPKQAQATPVSHE